MAKSEKKLSSKQGKPGKSAKRLPGISRDVSLGKHGYKVGSSKSSRRASLKRASKEIGTLGTMRRLNLITNYSKSKEYHDKMREDVEYLKGVYAREKKMSREKSAKKGSKKGKKIVKK